MSVYIYTCSGQPSGLCTKEGDHIAEKGTADRPAARANYDY